MFSCSRTANSSSCHYHVLLRESVGHKLSSHCSSGGGCHPHPSPLRKSEEDLTTGNEAHVILIYSDITFSRSTSSSSSDSKRRRRRSRKPNCSIYLDTVEAVFTVPLYPHLSSLPHIPHQRPLPRSLSLSHCPHSTNPRAGLTIANRLLRSK